MVTEKKYRGYIFLSFLKSFKKNINMMHGKICAKNFKYLKEEFCILILTSKPITENKLDKLLK